MPSVGVDVSVGVAVAVAGGTVAVAVGGTSVFVAAGVSLEQPSAATDSHTTAEQSPSRKARLERCMRDLLGSRRRHDEINQL